MANITPRYNKNGEITCYRIRVSRGYDSNGKRLSPYTTEFKPAPNLPKKQVEKELNRFVMDFETQCSYYGNATSHMRLSEFIPKYLETAQNTLSPSTRSSRTRRH